METGELVGGKIVIRHATISVKILTIRTRIDRADGHDEAQAIRRRHFTATPSLRQGDQALRVNEAGIGSRERLGADIVLLYPTEPTPREGGDRGMRDRFESEVTGFSQQDGTEAHG